VIEGKYPTEPQTLHFSYKYAKEGMEWKLFGLHVRLAAAEEKEDEGSAS